MKTIEMRSAIVVGSIALLMSVGVGQIQKKAQVGFRFLENVVSADAVGRGGVGVASMTNAMGVFWNPAGISWGESFADVAVHHTTGIADINYNAFAASLRLGSFGHLGFSFLSMDYGDFYGTRRADNTDGYVETGSFSPGAYAFGLVFSQKVSDRFSYGVQIKRATQDLGGAWVAPVSGSFSDPDLPISQRTYKKDEFAFDVGAYYDFGYKGVRFGAVLQNMSREIRFENDRIPMPFSVNFGATVEPLGFFLGDEESRSLVLSFESRHPRDFNEKLKIGAEYTWMEIVVLRAGYMTNYDERGFVAGLGVRQEFGDTPIRFDYAYQPFGVFGTVHHLTLGLSY